MRDVAREAGVSVATVSRVVADSGYPVAEATRLKVQEAVKRLGFVPNLLARTFSTSRTQTIGVTVPVLNAYYSKMLAGLEGRADEGGYSLLLSIVGSDHERREKAIDQFIARQLDGVVICSGSNDGALARDPAGMGVPTVIVGQQPKRGFPTVTVDNYRASQDATAHLLARGHRAIAFLTSNSEWPDFRDRLAGFRDCLADKGAAGMAEIVEGVFDEHDAYRAVGALIEKKGATTAVLAATDRMALGALAALADAGKAVPGSMAVVGFDNYHTSQFIRPSLSSVDMPADVMGAAAVDMVLEAIASGNPAMADRVIPHRLFVRQSS